MKAETKGQLYRHISAHFDFSKATTTSFRCHTGSMTSIAVCSPYVYTASTDSNLIKWKLASRPVQLSTTRHNKSTLQGKCIQTPPPIRRRPKKLLTIKPSKSTTTKDHKAPLRHTGSILTVAASSDGQFVVTGGDDNRLIVWSAEALQPLKAFAQHRDSITGLAFRRGTNQLYSASKDRTVKTWSLNELAYVETLFGHQDCVVDVAALAQERCLSAGARDRTARLWKVVDETQLIFLGGGGGGAKRLHKVSAPSTTNSNFTVGSLDRVAFIDEDTFITGSDNGSLMLWNLQKKKPIFIYSLAHGLQPTEKLENVSAEQCPEDVESIPRMPQSRWITALATLPYSDIIISGSWDGWVRAWKVSCDKRRIEALGPIGNFQANAHQDEYVVNGSRSELSQTNGRQDEGTRDFVNDFQDRSQAIGQVEIEKVEDIDKQGVKGVINDLKIFERGEKGNESLCIVAAVGKEHRLGRWMQLDGRNDAIILDIPKIRVGRKKKKTKSKGRTMVNVKEEERLNESGGSKMLV